VRRNSFPTGASQGIHIAIVSLDRTSAQDGRLVYSPLEMPLYLQGRRFEKPSLMLAALLWGMSVGCNVERPLSLTSPPELTTTLDMGPSGAGGDLPDAGSPPAGDGSTDGGRVWGLLAGPGPWSFLLRSAAIDSRERLFVTDGTNVYSISSGATSVYLSNSAIASVLGPQQYSAVQHIDVGPDDRLYLYLTDVILVSSASGQVSVHRDLRQAGLFGWTFSVVNSDQILMVETLALDSVTATSVSQLYGSDVISDGANCAGQSIAAQADGIFFYIPGCNGTPVLRGKADGSGAGVLLRADQMKPRLSVDFFSSVARRPSGGFLVSTESWQPWSQALVQFDEAGSWFEIKTHPSMTDYAQRIGSSGTFHGRPVLMGPSGAIYVVAQAAVYWVTP
jgi:hypothetical protein